MRLGQADALIMTRSENQTHHLSTIVLKSNAVTNLCFCPTRDGHNNVADKNTNGQTCMQHCSNLREANMCLASSSLSCSRQFHITTLSSTLLAYKITACTHGQEKLGGAATSGER